VGVSVTGYRTAAGPLPGFVSDAARLQAAEPVTRVSAGLVKRTCARPARSANCPVRRGTISTASRRCWASRRHDRQRGTGSNPDAVPNVTEVRAFQQSAFSDQPAPGEAAEVTAEMLMTDR
jgi:hypothetical protein